MKSLDLVEVDQIKEIKKEDIKKQVKHFSNCIEKIKH